MPSILPDSERGPELATDAPPVISRRVVLAGLLTAYTASMIPWAVAQSAPDADRGNFLAVSALIAGRQSLDTDLAMRYYDALVAADPNFPTSVTTLLTLINRQQVDPLQLQAMLDESHPDLAGIPRKVATAWFLGMVESGDGVKVLAYEHALNAEAVSDVLKPPSYCFGGYGSWAEVPTGGKPSV